MMLLKKMINRAMNEMNLNYAYMEWNAVPDYPYFVGEYSEFEPLMEDGMQDKAFILTGFTRGTWSELDAAKEKIERYFNTINGKTAIDADGTAVAVFYSTAFPIRMESGELKKIQIELKVKEWKVN